MGELVVEDLAAAFALNALAMVVLAYALYFRRHRRRDLFVGYMAVNASLFAVTAALGSSDPIHIGVGFGLFAVLSIVRLRSDEATPVEICYMMSSLVLGLLSGLPGLAIEMKALLILIVMVTMYVADHPNVLPPGRHVRFRVVLETVHTDRDLLRAELERRLGGRVQRMIVRNIDYFRETMQVDVRMDAGAEVPAPLTEEVRL
jgi:hypothetical protein